MLEKQRPVVVNYNGKQMQLNVVQQMYGDLRTEQPFARPSTPEDNPYIVALFSTTKRSPTYPGPGWSPADDPTVVQGYRDISYTIFFLGQQRALSFGYRLCNAGTATYRTGIHDFKATKKAVASLTQKSYRLLAVATDNR